jgi:hypothetical protein
VTAAPRARLEMPMQRTARWLLLLVALALPAVAPRAENVKSLAPGAALPGGALTLGPRTWVLPGDGWKLAGRHVRELRINETRGGVEVIEAFAAQVRDGRMDAGVIFTAPSAGAGLATPWREDALCRIDKALLKDDRSSATLSDCLIIRVLPGVPREVPGADVFAAATQWLQAENVRTPRPVLQVLIVKYVASEYLRLSAWFDPAVFGVRPEQAAALTAAPEPAVQWARDARALVDAALARPAGTFTLPPLPAR